VDLVQSRIVTADVAGLVGFYTRLVGRDVVANDYYVEIPTRGQRIAVSRVRFSELVGPPCEPHAVTGDVILDFEVKDIERHHARIDALGVEWVMPPTLQPWGRRSMQLRDPEGHLVNIFSSTKEDQS
jgi:uncharacterized glyoxalase superfamily protein PhnB